MQNNAYRKLLKLKLSHNSFGLYFHEKPDKAFEVSKNVKILRFKGDSDELRANI